MREMLRIKRSIQAIYNTQFNMMAVQYMNSSANEDGERAGGAMSQLEAKAKDVLLAQSRIITNTENPADSQIRFVRGETQGVAGDKTKVANPDEIDIGDSEDDEDEDEDEVESQDNNEQSNKKDSTVSQNNSDSLLKKLRIEQKTIPAKVFGGLKPSENDEDEEEDNAIH